MSQKARDIVIMVGAVIGFIEFMVIDTDLDGQGQVAGMLHALAAVVMLVSLLLYVSTWKVAWITLLRAIFAGFLTFMMVVSFQRALELF